MRAITATVNAAVQQALVNLDSWTGAAMGIQVNPTNGAAYTLDYSFDDPNDMTSPIPLLNMWWDRSMIPGAAISTVGFTFNMPTAPIWFRVRAMNGVGQTRATFLQLGIHSRSNIVIPQDDLLVTGPNMAAMNGNGNGRN